MGVIDQPCRGQIEAIAFLRIAEGQLEHIKGRRVILLVEQCGQIKRRHLAGIGAPHHLGIGLVHIIGHFLMEAAEHHVVQHAAPGQGLIEKIHAPPAQLSLVFHLNDIAVVAVAAEIIQNILQPQDAQRVGHRVAVQVGVGHFSLRRFKLRAHIQLPKLRVCLILGADVGLSKHRFAVGSPVKHIVMQQDQNIVPGDMQVKFKEIDIEGRILHTVLKSHHRFFRHDARAASVGGNFCRILNIGIRRFIPDDVGRVRPVEVLPRPQKGRSGQQQQDRQQRPA